MHFFQRFVETTRPGFEPGQREPKSLVLPLHYRVIHPTHLSPARPANTSYHRSLFVSRNSVKLGCGTLERADASYNATMNTWKIAAVQMDCRFGDVASNLEQLRAR